MRKFRDRNRGVENSKPTAEQLIGMCVRAACAGDVQLYIGIAKSAPSAHSLLCSPHFKGALDLREIYKLWQLLMKSLHICFCFRLRHHHFIGKRSKNVCRCLLASWKFVDFT